MEFSYRISEAEYLKAWKLRTKASGSRATKTIMFWVFIMVCLFMLWAIVQRQAQVPAHAQQPVVSSQTVGAAQNAPFPLRAILINIGPFIIILAVWGVLLTKLGPRSVLQMYRKDPTMQGEFTVSVTSESIASQNTAGASWKAAWNIFAFWKEGKDIIVLFYHTGAYAVLNLAGLFEMQRSELRGILSTALPKR